MSALDRLLAASRPAPSPRYRREVAEATRSVATDEAAPLACGNPPCPAFFHPRHPNQRFCSVSCRRAAWETRNRLRRATVECVLADIETAVGKLRALLGEDE